MYMHGMRGMGDTSSPAATDYIVPLIDVVPPTPDQLPITSEYPVVNAGTPTLSSALSMPVIAGFTGKQVLVGLAAFGLLYLLLRRK